MFTLWSRHPETSAELRCWTAVMVSPNAPYRSRRIVESGRESDIIMLNNECGPEIIDEVMISTVCHDGQCSTEVFSYLDEINCHQENHPQRDITEVHTRLANLGWMLAQQAMMDNRRFERELRGS